MWRRSLLFSLVTILAFSFAIANTGNAISEDNSQIGLIKAKMENNESLTQAEKDMAWETGLIEDQIAPRPYYNSGLRGDVSLTFEDDSDVANWGVHGGTSGYTTVAWDATAGVAGSGAIVFGDGGYGFYIKRAITATVGSTYNLSIDVKTVGWDTPGTYDITLAVEGLEAAENAVSINALADFTTITLTGTVTNADGYIKLEGSNTSLTNAGGVISATIDNLVFDDAIPYFAEGFETWPPTDWTLDPSGVDGEWLQGDGTYHGPGSVVEGSNAAYFDVWNYSSGTSGAMATPAIDLSGATAPRLIFQHWNSSGSDPVDVSVSTDGTAYTSVWTGSSSVSSWEEVIVDLAAYAGNATVYVQFSCTSDYGSTNPNIDAVLIEEAPTNPIMGLSASALDFGALPISMTGMMTLTVSNTGGGTLNITSITPTAGVFVASPADMIVDPGATQDLTVTFTPDAVGTFTDDLIIISDADSSPDTVSLDGSGAASSGGPDIAGYTWVNSYDAAGPAYAWIDTTDAIDAIIAYGDDYRGTIDLPFLFRFYGNVYSQITATTNGWIGMGPSSGYSSSYWTNETILDASTPNNIIAPFWDDLKAGDAPGSTSSYMGTILYKTVGVAPDRQFVVIFQDVVRSYGDTDGFTFEVIFDETTSDITLQYADVTGNASADNGIGATVGIENADGTDGLLYNYNGAPNLLYDDLAIYFEAPAAPATPGMVLDIQEYDFDVVPVGFGASLDVTIINDGGADLVVTGATVNAPFSTAFSGTIPALQSAVATIDFDPATVGTFAEVLTFAVTGAYTGSDTVALAGSSYAVHAALDEGFEGGTFPPADWSVTTTDASGDAWEAANDGSSHGPGTVAEGTLAAMADIYNMSSGTVSHMYSPAADLSGMSAPRLSFWWQCMTGSGTQPSLTVNYSIDGGSTWSELYYQEADGTADDWVNVKVFLPEFSAGTMFDFVAFSDYGSYNMFLDAVLVEEGPVLTPFFSEYMEGSGSNKGLEIYNATGADIDLDEYQIAQSVNGGGWQYYHAFPAGATLANGDLWLIVTDAAFPEMIAMADEVLGYPSVVNHNGDDARALIKIVGTDTTFMDVIGIPTEDPGSGWDVAGVAVGTQNHNLVRKADVETGNVDWLASAGTDVDNSEWIVFEQDYWYGMGYHNEAYPLPGESCELAFDYGVVNDATAMGAIDSYGADWYSFYNDGTFDNVTVSLCGTSFDSKLEVWEACDSLDYLAFNDDACGLQSEISLDTLAAGTYFVKVYGYGSSSGDYTLNVIGTNGMPDFVVTSMEYFGQDTLQVVVTNQGEADSPGYFGTDYHGLYIDGDYLGYVAVNDVALAVGESYTYDIIGFNYDTFGDGDYWIHFMADVDNDVEESDEDNNLDSLLITIELPPLAPRHVVAEAGENHVTLYWETAVLPEPVPAALSNSLIGISDERSKPAVTLSPELIAKRDLVRGDALRDAGDTCAEAVVVLGDSAFYSAPYAPYWYAYTATIDGFLTISSDGATVDTKVYLYADCDSAYIAYNDDGGSGLSSIVTIPILSGATYYIEWTDTWSASGFDWTLTENATLPMADLAVTEMYFEDEAVWAVVGNLGDLTAAGVSCHWYVDGVDVGYAYTAGLEPGAADTLGLLGFTWENLGAGTFNVGILVDYWSSVDESNEDNNTDSIEVTIEAPDYMPTYNVYRDSVMIAAALEAVNTSFDGEYLDIAVVADVEYTYYVTQILDDETESLGSESVSATPWAPVILPFPYTEDFEDYVDHNLEFGWTVEEIGTPDGGNWEVGDSTYFEGNAYNYWHVPGGSIFAAIDDDGFGSGVNGNEILWTPWFDLTTAVEPQITFNYTVRGGNGGQFMVLSGDTISAIYPLTDSPSEWSGALFNLGEYAGELIKVGFHYDDNGGWAYGLAVDDITVEETPLPGTISGTVADGDGNAIGYADVHVYGAFADEGTMTDVAGAYTVTVPAGEYQVDVMRVNYDMATATVMVTEGGATVQDFVLNFTLPAPENLMAYPEEADTTIALNWAAPMPMGQLAYDDGTYESFYWVSSTGSTLDHYFAAHFKAPITPGYAINEVAILTTADDAESAFENVFVVGSDTMGGPDFANVLWTATGNNAATYPELAWDFYPVGVNPSEQEFWVVMQWPDGNMFGPYVATDMDTFIGNSIYSAEPDTSGNPIWNVIPGTFAVRAYLSEPETGRSVVLHGSETTTIEKVGSAIALDTKQDVSFAGSVEAPAITNLSRELLNYNVYRSLDPMVFSDIYATAAGESFNDDGFDFDTEYFYAVSAVYDEGESEKSNTAGFTYFSPLFLNHYESFTYPDETPLADIGWVTDDGAGNVAANFGIEDEMLHFDWSPTATDFYQTVTSPIADFTAATQARIGYYLYFDDYSDSDNGTLDFWASLSNDGFLTEHVLVAHNDSIFGNIEEYMLHDVSDIVMGSGGWQLRFTVTGATSFTLDHLWVDDVIVESDVNMGPADFDLLTPGDADQVVITTANVANGALAFTWESAGTDMRYGVELSGSLGTIVVPFDTSATEVVIPYAVLDAAFDLAGSDFVEGTWDIFAYNDLGMVYASNGPFALTIGTTVGTDEMFIPEVYDLFQNYPNPFNPVTSITYDIPEAAQVRLVVYDLLGQPVRVLVNDYQNARRYQLEWNGLSDVGLPLSSGIYIYRLETDAFVKTMKMMYLK